MAEYLLAREMVSRVTEEALHSDLSVARKQARESWHSWVLYQRDADGWTELDSGGVGFGHARIRRHVAKRCKEPHGAVTTAATTAADDGANATPKNPGPDPDPNPNPPTACAAGCGYYAHRGRGHCCHVCFASPGWHGPFCQRLVVGATSDGGAPVRAELRQKAAAFCDPALAQPLLQAVARLEAVDVDGPPLVETHGAVLPAIASDAIVQAAVFASACEAVDVEGASAAGEAAHACEAVDMEGAPAAGEATIHAYEAVDVSRRLRCRTLFSQALAQVRVYQPHRPVLPSSAASCPCHLPVPLAHAAATGPHHPLSPHTYTHLGSHPNPIAPAALTPYTSHRTHHTSPITPHPSHLTHHISPITHHPSPITAF